MKITSESIWGKSTYFGRVVGVTFLVLFSYLALTAIPSSPKSTAQICLTTNQIDVLVSNLHNANSKGSEVDRALRAIKVFHGAITVVNKATNEIAFTWKCVDK